jgi:hypothetical protein
MSTDENRYLPRTETSDDCLDNEHSDDAGRRQMDDNAGDGKGFADAQFCTDFDNCNEDNSRSSAVVRLTPTTSSSLNPATWSVFRDDAQFKDLFKLSDLQSLQDWTGANPHKSTCATSSMVLKDVYDYSDDDDDDCNDAYSDNGDVGELLPEDYEKYVGTEYQQYYDNLCRDEEEERLEDYEEGFAEAFALLFY